MDQVTTATHCVECGHTDRVESCDCAGNDRLNRNPCPCAATNGVCSACGLLFAGHRTRTRDGKLWTKRGSYASSVKHGLHEFISSQAVRYRGAKPATQKVGAVVIFRDGVTVEVAEAAMMKLMGFFPTDPGSRAPILERVVDVRSFNPEHGEPVFYVP